MSLAQSLIRSVKLRGMRGTFRTILNKIVPPQIRNIELYRSALTNKVGLEIGGPSPLFDDGGVLPVYPVLKTLDNCNFSASTIWEGTLKDGMTFTFHKDKPVGRQYISEAVDLRGIPNETYDVLISSNAIEHVANPLKALQEWKRVVKENGCLVLVVPHRDGTFDHNRPITPFQHILEDFNRNTGEDDLTHLEEILSLHDLEMDPQAGDKQSFRERSLRNFENRCLHHHVFDSDLVVKLLDHVGLQILSVDPCLPFYINVLAMKLRPSVHTANQAFVSRDAIFRKRSPFKSDRRVMT